MRAEMIMKLSGPVLSKLHYEAGLTFTCKGDGFLREESLQPRLWDLYFTDPPRPL